MEPTLHHPDGAVEMGGRRCRRAHSTSNRLPAASGTRAVYLEVLRFRLVHVHFFSNRSADLFSRACRLLRPDYSPRGDLLAVVLPASVQSWRRFQAIRYS